MMLIEHMMMFPQLFIQRQQKTYLAFSVRELWIKTINWLDFSTFELTQQTKEPPNIECEGFPKFFLVCNGNQ